ncbi:coth protein-domain-containing protein [Fennellomyces sp. T-0311]|nr:coth protein-domain-containing protein [Fennellomyces sp. T-0311]
MLFPSHIYSLLMNFVRVLQATTVPNVQYRVISSIPSNTSMAVVIDGTHYTLEQSAVDPIVYTGTLPEAKEAYYYAKITEDRITEREPFVRLPVNDVNTPFEFYNRSRNYWDIASLPQMFEPSYNRIQSDLHLDGEIATMHIMGNRSGIDYMHKNVVEDVKVAVDFSFIRGNEMKIFKDVEIELSGRGSRYDPKLSYNLKIPKGGDTLYGFRRLKLRALASDPSYLREAVVYKVFESAAVATTKFSYIRLFINGRPIGLFGFIESFKNPFLRNEFNNGKKYSQGNLYQGLFAANATNPDLTNISDLSYKGENQTTYELGQYKIKEDPSDGNPSFLPLINLIKFIADAPCDDVEAWKRKFDMDSVLRSLALEVVLGFSDGYISLADNWYIYQDGLNSERFIFIPSDVDLSFGSTLMKVSDMLSGNYSTYPHLLERPLITQMLCVPEFKHQFEKLLQDFARTIAHPDTIFKMIDDLAAMIRQDVVDWDQALSRVHPLNGEPSKGDSINKLPPDFLKLLDKEAVLEQLTRKPIPFDVAVNGKTGYVSLAGLKDYITRSSQAILSFYGQ